MPNPWDQCQKFYASADMNSKLIHHSSLRPNRVMTPMVHSILTITASSTSAYSAYQKDARTAYRWSLRLRYSGLRRLMQLLSAKEAAERDL